MMELSEDDITLLLIAQNARFRIASRLTMKHKTGYQIRCECDLFGRTTIPPRVFNFLQAHGLPVQNRYTKDEHLNRMLRLLKPFRDFTLDPQGYCAVANHLGSLPEMKTHDDVLEMLEVLDDDTL